MHGTEEPLPTMLSFNDGQYGAGARHRAHRHDELHFSMVLRGSIAETVNGVAEFAQALSVVAKDAGVTHANDFGPEGARVARLSLHDGTIGQLIDDSSRNPGWRWTHDVRVARPFLQLVRRAGGRGAVFAVDDPDVVDLLAAFTARPVAPRGTPPSWLTLVMEEIRDGWCPTVTVSTTARRAGVHPVYLARCVRRWYGTGLAEELRRLRVRAAASRLARDSGTISEVAHSGGYADEPHLNRDFRNATGLTPGQFRSLVHGAKEREGRFKNSSRQG
jgi:AraC family transcriptional regulator